MKGLVLRDIFRSHPSNRVFFDPDSNTVYKVYKDKDHKKRNYNLMESLGYFKNLVLHQLSKTYQLLSYTVMKGGMEPNNFEQIEAAKHWITKLHEMGLVHADIRIGNIVFCQPHNQAFLIDFDFTESAGSEYHEGYNCDLSERHPDIKNRNTTTKEYCHDRYALNWISRKYFEVSVYEEFEAGCFQVSFFKINNVQHVHTWLSN